MLPEVESAANFLSDLLRAQCVAPHQLQQFRQSVIDHLLANYHQHWFPEQPFKGSGYRCLRINHKMDPMLSRAGRVCGLEESALRSLFPSELTLWVDPNEVSYRIGENGSICVIYEPSSIPDSRGRQSYSPVRLSPSPPTSSLGSGSSSCVSSVSSSPVSSPSNWFVADRQSPPMGSHSALLGSAAKKSFYFLS